MASLGIIIGTMSGDVKTLEKLKKDAGSVEEFLSLAGDLANVSLVAAATKAAIGYDFDEVQVETKRMMDGYNADGSGIRIREVPVGEKHTKKHIKSSEILLKFLISNRMPQYFADTKHVVINKRVVEIKADAEAEIKKFAGKLLEAVAIEAEFVDDLARPSIGPVALPSGQRQQEDEPTANEAGKAPGSPAKARSAETVQ